MMKSPDKVFFLKASSLICLFSTIFAELSVKPQNTLTKLGKETSLECCSKQSHAALQWKFQKWNNGGHLIKICSGHTCQGDRYSINSSITGCSDLIINSSSSDVAGLYQCNEVGTKDVGGAYLVVYEFNCQHNLSSKSALVEGNKVVFNCTAIWNGKLPFEITWMIANGKEIEKKLFSEWQEFYSSSIPVDLIRPHLPSYTVTIQFLNTAVTDERVDTHSPIISWTSTEQQVMYAVSNIRTNCPEKKCEKNKGDTINCSADGFPAPEFQWLDWDLKPLATSSVLQMELVGHFKYTCVSKNIILGQKYEARETIVVTVVEKTNEMAQSTIVVIVVGVVVIFILIVLVVILIVLVVIFSVIARKVLRVAAEYFSEHKNAGKRSGSGTRTSNSDEIQLQNFVPLNSDDYRDNDPKQEYKDPKETERCLPVQQVADADFDASIDDGTS